MKTMTISNKIIDSRKPVSVIGNFRQDNGKFKPLLVVRDRSEMFTPGVSTFGITEMRQNLIKGVFEDGMMFLYDGMALIVENGRLMHDGEYFRV